MYFPISLTKVLFAEKSGDETTQTSETTWVGGGRSSFFQTCWHRKPGKWYRWVVWVMCGRQSTG